MMHGRHCTTKTYRTRCPRCGVPVFFFSCEHGSAVFFDDLGDPWPIHRCGVRYVRPSRMLLITTKKPPEVAPSAHQPREILTFRETGVQRRFQGAVVLTQPANHNNLKASRSQGQAVPDFHSQFLDDQHHIITVRLQNGKLLTFLLKPQMAGLAGGEQFPHLPRRSDVIQHVLMEVKLDGKKFWFYDDPTQPAKGQKQRTKKRRRQ